MKKVSWQGVYPAVLTPFKEDDSIDFEMFRINTEAQIDAGIDGIVLGGSLGEASTLELSEKNDLLVYAAELVSERIPVIMNIAEQSTKAAVLAAVEAEKYGADGLMLLPPMRYSADDEETVAFFKAVAQNTSLPIMLYNNPVDYKIFIKPQMFEALASQPNIQAVKESSRDVVNITRMFNRFGNRFRVLTGVDPLAYESLCLGADGWVAGLVDAFPRETVAIYQLVKAGYHAQALEIYRWFIPLLELDIHPKLVQNIKLAAAATGIGTEYVRAPRLKLSGKERESVLNVINTSLKNRPALPDYMNLQASKTLQAI